MWKCSPVVGALCAALLAMALWAQRQDLPAGLMQEKARTACLACHEGRIIVQQHLSRRGWTKSVDKMIRWGAPVAPEDREALLDYLAQNFGPEEPRAKAELAGGAGAEAARAACLGCHDADLITEQQLDRRGWTREVDKMVRWGAVVRPEDRAALLNYLVTNYGPPAGTAKEGGVLGGIVGGISGSPKLIRVGDEVQKGKLISQIPPVYRPLAKQARIQGTVRLQAIIAEDGSVEQLEVLSGHPLLVQAALDAVRQWRYQPILLNGEPVLVVTTIDVTFALTSSAGQ